MGGAREEIVQRVRLPVKGANEILTQRCTRHIVVWQGLPSLQLNTGTDQTRRWGGRGRDSRHGRGRQHLVHDHILLSEHTARDMPGTWYDGRLCYPTHELLPHAGGAMHFLSESTPLRAHASGKADILRC